MTFAWFEIGNGRRVYRKVPEPIKTRSDLPCPYTITDAIEPTQSMADGRWYTSKSALRATYRPSGNPEGARFIEVGNEYAKPYTPPAPKIDEKGIDAALQKAVARFERGERVTP